MSSQTIKTPKPVKPPNQSPSSSLSTHFAMIELKQKILTLLSKLSDRDTHKIAVEDLEKTIQTLTPETIPMLLNCLYEAINDPSKPSVKKEALRLLAHTCTFHGDLTATHLPKIIACIVKRLKDSDSGVKDSCRDAIGALSARYFRGEGENGGTAMVGLFVKPLFEAMGDQNKGVQSGAAMCMVRMVECATNPPVGAFQKLCGRVYKLLNNPNFLANAALLPVVASLSQVGALAPQSLELLLQSIHDCLVSTDWATRKAAADTLSALALHSSSLFTDRATSTLTVLEAARFDKIKPVRDSITDALNLWKKVSGKEESSSDGGNSESAELSKNEANNSNSKEKRVTSSTNSSPTSDSVSKNKGGSISDKAVAILKKKAPALTDKEPNPEFFLKLEGRVSDDLPVEVVVPRRCLDSSNSHNEDESEQKVIDSKRSVDNNSLFNNKYRNIERGTASSFSRQRDNDNSSHDNGKDPRTRPLDAEGSLVNNKGNWLAIQRQLLHLERQQAHLMDMLQDFMGGSHDNMLTLENRVRGLERVVEDMARDLSMSSNRRVGNFPAGYEGSSSRPISKFNGFSDYSGAKIGRGGDGRIPYGERYPPSRRPDMSEAWDFHSYGSSKNGQMGPRRTLDVRSPKSDHESDMVSSRRAWDKGSGPGPLRHGEGPSARSVWQASKDEATLEAIRVAGDDNGSSAHSARVAIPELTAEAMGDDNMMQERDPAWTAWSNAMDALHVADMDSAFAEVLSIGDDMLLVKLMDRTGPVIDQLSNEIAREILNAVGQFFMEQDLFDICLAWIQQLIDVVMESGADVFGIPMEVKKEILFNLHEASSTMEPPQDWEGAAPDQLLLQLASAWEIDLQQFEK